MHAKTSGFPITSHREFLPRLKIDLRRDTFKQRKVILGMILASALKLSFTFITESQWSSTTQKNRWDKRFAFRPCMK